MSLSYNDCKSQGLKANLPQKQDHDNENSDIKHNLSYRFYIATIFFLDFFCQISYFSLPSSGGPGLRDAGETFNFALNSAGAPGLTR